MHWMIKTRIGQRVRLADRVWATPFLVRNDHVWIGLEDASRTPARRAGPTTRNRLHLLVVEDDPLHADVLQKILLQCGVSSVTLAMNADQALNILQNQDAAKEPPNLVILDLHLPDQGGDTVLNVIRSKPRLSALPVVMLSSTGTAREIETCLRHGANAFLRKSTSYPEFCDAIQALVRFWSLAADLPTPPSMRSSAHPLLFNRFVNEV